MLNEEPIYFVNITNTQSCSYSKWLGYYAINIIIYKYKFKNSYKIQLFFLHLKRI